MNDKVFGELKYDLFWSKQIVVQFDEKDVEITLMIDGEDDGLFKNEQYQTYNVLMEKWPKIHNDVQIAILKYYEAKHHELGYDVEKKEQYPPIESTTQLLSHITITGLMIPWPVGFESNAVGLTFDCTWDVENGIGVLILDSEVSEVGYQDSVM